MDVANSEVEDFVEWLRTYNGNRPYENRVSFHGLDLYSPYTSNNAVLRYSGAQAVENWSTLYVQL
jgi:erythromycin esterase-like protein